MTIPASKNYLVRAVKRTIRFLDDRKIKCLDDLARNGSNVAKYPDGDSIRITTGNKGPSKNRIYTLSYISPHKGGRIFEARTESESLGIIFTIKASSLMFGYHSYMGMGEIGKDDYGCVEQSKTVRSTFGIPVIKGELKSLLSDH